MSRTRYLYTQGGVPLEKPIEISEDYQLAERRAPVATEGIVYGNAVATDGTPLDSRRKHAEYMRRNGLAMASDYTGTWQQKQAERDKLFSAGGYDKERRKAHLVESWKKLEAKGRLK